MTVRELIEHLSKLPPDAEVECDFDEGWRMPAAPVLRPDGKVWIGVL